MVNGEPEREGGEERDQNGYAHAVESSVVVCYQAGDITAKAGAAIRASVTRLHKGIK